MTRVTHHIGQSPFEDADFRDLQTDPTSTVRPRPSAQFDLIAAITTARQTADAFVSVRTAVVVGTDPAPFMADARARFEELAMALGYEVNQPVAAE